MGGIILVFQEAEVKTLLGTLFYCIDFIFHPPGCTILLWGQSVMQIGQIVVVCWMLCCWLAYVSSNWWCRCNNKDLSVKLLLASSTDGQLLAFKDTVLQYRKGRLLKHAHSPSPNGKLLDLQLQYLFEKLNEVVFCCATNSCYYDGIERVNLVLSQSSQNWCCYS